LKKQHRSCQNIDKTSPHPVLETDGNDSFKSHSIMCLYSFVGGGNVSKNPERPRAPALNCAKVPAPGTMPSFPSIAVNDAGPKFFDYAFWWRLVTLLPSFKITDERYQVRTKIQGSEPPEHGRLRGFWALIITQFQGAFSDNALKWLAIFLIIGMNLPDEKRDQLVGSSVRCSRCRSSCFR
jgi:hypothetical protein